MVQTQTEPIYSGSSIQNQKKGEGSKRIWLIVFLAFVILLVGFIVWQFILNPTDSEGTESFSPDQSSGPVTSTESTTAIFLRSITQDIFNGMSESDFESNEQRLQAIIKDSDMTADQKHSALDILVLGYEKIYGSEGLRNYIPQIESFIEESDSPIEKIMFLQSLSLAYEYLNEEENQIKALRRAKEIIEDNQDDEDVVIEGSYVLNTLNALEVE